MITIGADETKLTPIADSRKAIATHHLIGSIFLPKDFHFSPQRLQQRDRFEN